MACSCKQTMYTEDIPNIIINNKDLADEADISDIIESVSIVPLKESPDHHIGDVTKLFVCRSRYIVWDRFVTKQILLFDRKGNFMKVIMKTGDSPNETLQINDCWINNKNELEVYDYALKKVYQFDSTFTLYNTIKSPDFYMLNNIIRLPGSNEFVGYAGYIKNPAYKEKFYRVSYMDQNLKITRTEMHYDKIYRGIQWPSISNHFYLFKDSMRLFQQYDNYVYNVNQEGIKKIFKLTYTRNPLPDNLLENMPPEKVSVLRNRSASIQEQGKVMSEYQKFARFSGIWLENEKYIYFPSREKNSYFFTFINKRTRKEAYSAKVLCETERYRIIIPFLKFYDSENKSFMATAFGDQMKVLVQSDSKFRNEIQMDPETFYVFNIKIKE